MDQKVANAFSRLKKSMIFGVILYLILAIAKRQFLFDYQFIVIAVMATLNVLFMLVQIISILKVRTEIPQFSKMRLTLWVCAIYGVLLTALGWLEVFLR